MPTQKFLRERFDYQDGQLIYRYSVPLAPKGTVVKTRCKKNNRLVVGIDHKRYYVHRLIWVWHFGPIPPTMQVDHLDHNRLNNKIENLRLVTHSENHRNVRRHDRNKTGVSGVIHRPKRNVWEVVIGAHGKILYLGSYKTFQEAVQVRRNAEKEYNYHPNHGRVVE